MEQLSSRCCCLHADGTTDRPCLGYIRGDRFALQVDGGNSPAHFRLMQNALAGEGLPPADMIAVTHSHWDHTYGLCAASVPVIACDKTQEHLLRMASWAWTPGAMTKRLRTGEDILFCHENLLKEYADPSTIRVRTADVVFHQALSLDLGGVHAQLLHLENSHADDCVVVYVPEEKVIFLGDITYEDLHHRPPCYHRARFEQLCEALRRLDFVMAVPGHSGPFSRSELTARLAEALMGDLPVLP